MKTPVFTCTIYPKSRTLNIFRDGNTIGYVKEVKGEPHIEWFADINHVAHIPFSAIEIVMDCWNTMVNDLDNPSFVLTPVKK